MKCATCHKTIADNADWVKLRRGGGYTAFHTHCFGAYLKRGAADQLERLIWLGDRKPKPAALAAARTRGGKQKGRAD